MKDLTTKGHLIEHIIQSPFGIGEELRDRAPCCAISIQYLLKGRRTEVLISRFGKRHHYEFGMKTLEHNQVRLAEHRKSHSKQVF